MGNLGRCWKWIWCPGPDLNRHDRIDREILSLLCLPIPPPGHRATTDVTPVGVEARAGIEPASADLQSAA